MSQQEKDQLLQPLVDSSVADPELMELEPKPRRYAHFLFKVAIISLLASCLLLVLTISAHHVCSHHRSNSPSQGNNYDLHQLETISVDFQKPPPAPLFKRYQDSGLDPLLKKRDIDEKMKKKLEHAEKAIKDIKKEEENKRREMLQKQLSAIEREIAVNDQKNYKYDLGLFKEGEVVEPSGQKVMVLTASDGNGANSLIKNVMDMAEENRREYCDYHNYVYKFINISQFDLQGAHPVWGKLNALQKAFDDHPDVEWIWWMDVDMIIMNPEIDLAKHALNPEVLKKRLSYGRPIKHPSYAQFSNIRTGYNPDVPLPPGAAKPIYDDIELEDYEYADVNKIDLIIDQDYWGLNAGSFFIRRSNFIELLLDYWSDPVFVDREFTFREQDTLGHLNVNHKAVRERIGIVPQRMLNSYIADDLWSGFEDGDLTIHFAGCWIPGDCDARWSRHWKTRKRVPEKYRNTHSNF